MKGNKALRRAVATTDVIRLGTNLPLITDATELITPEVAKEYLKKNKCNRPIKWHRVEEYARLMSSGQWALHSQGIILDENGFLLTGQNRLWAVSFSDVSVYMRVSRGNPRSAAKLIDRGCPQSARDLATRDTEKKHSPTESSIARALCVIRGNLRPSTDMLAATISENSLKAAAILAETTGTKKTRAVLMIMAVVCLVSSDATEVRRLAKRTPELADRLEAALAPQSADSCWGKGAAFSLALEHARSIVRSLSS